jgi:tRNA nucleotidyltransferase (CCA-adding enzyme)
MSKNESPGSIYKLLIRSEDAAELAWILAALSPWADVPLPPARTGKKTCLPWATLVAKEGIKSSNRICDTVTGAFRNFEEITIFKKAVINQEKWTSERDTLGMAIRRWDANGGHWKVQAMLAILVEVMRSNDSDGEFVMV